MSDQVVAPVRETCAQALGAAFKYMHRSLILETLNILLQMQVDIMQKMNIVLNIIGNVGFAIHLVTSWWFFCLLLCSV